MFNLADAWGWRPSGSNPCRGVPRFRVEKHERFLTREDLYRLGEALRAAPAERLASTHAAAAIRLLVLTGCRRNEILGLRWDDLNFDTGEMRLPDTKTGTRMVPLTPAVARVFDGLACTPANARTLAATLAERGIGIVGWGTDTHMVLLNLASVGLLGSQAETALARAGITSNRNPVPFDAQSPSKWTGLRLGVSAATTRGFGTADMEVLGECIADLLHAEARSDPEPAKLRARVATSGSVRG